MKYEPGCYQDGTIRIQLENRSAYTYFTFATKQVSIDFNHKIGLDGVPLNRLPPYKYTHSDVCIYSSVRIDDLGLRFVYLRLITIKQHDT